MEDVSSWEDERQQGGPRSSPRLGKLAQMARQLKEAWGFLIYLCRDEARRELRIYRELTRRIRVERENHRMPRQQDFSPLLWRCEAFLARVRVLLSEIAEGAGPKSTGSAGGASSTSASGAPAKPF